MGIFGIFKAISSINKAEKFIKQHEDAKAKVQALVEKAEDAIAYYQAHKEQIETAINTAKTVATTLRAITGK